jgi:putative oxidoreductase
MQISGKYLHCGLLFLRASLGILYIIHGFPKLIGGPETWEDYGEAMQYLGISAYPIVFGFLAAMTEVFGGFFLIIGLYMKPVLILLIITMTIATFQLIGEGNPYSIYSHPLKMVIVFLAMLFTGPGKYSMDEKINRTLRR